MESKWFCFQRSKPRNEASCVPRLHFCTALFLRTKDAAVILSKIPTSDEQLGFALRVASLFYEKERIYKATQRVAPTEQVHRPTRIQKSVLNLELRFFLFFFTAVPLKMMNLMRFLNW